MAVIIRLTRGGRKKIARYRVVAADSRFPRDGRFLETLGTYNPQSQPKQFSVDVQRVNYWLEQGAEVSDTVRNLLKEDRFSEKLQAIEKGLDVSKMDFQRRPERVKKAKIKAKVAKEAKAASAAKES